MKSYNNLFSQITRETLVEAFEEAIKGKENREDIKRILEMPYDQTVEWFDRIYKQIQSKTWKPKKHKLVSLQEGCHRKERLIQKPRFAELVVQHALMIPFRPIFLGRSYRFSMGSVPGNGPSKALKAAVKWRDSYKGKPFYVAELDIRKFYQSVDIEILKRKLSKLIRDRDYLDLLFTILDNTPQGLPLGFYTSPWMANFYLTSFDNYVMQELKLDHYLRYLDNLFIFSDDKQKLNNIVDKVCEYLDVELHLTIKPDKQVYRFEYVDENGEVRGRAINFLGYVIHHNRVCIRKSILERIRRKALKVEKQGYVKIIDARAMSSYRGYFLVADAYQYYVKYIRPHCSFYRCKHKILLYSNRNGDGTFQPLSKQQIRKLYRKKKKRGRYYP